MAAMFTVIFKYQSISFTTNFKILEYQNSQIGFFLISHSCEEIFVVTFILPYILKEITFLLLSKQLWLKWFAAKSQNWQPETAANF